MKLRLLPFAVVLVILGGCASAIASSKGELGAKNLMHDRRTLSQMALERLATENYGLTTLHSALIRAKTQEAGWSLFGITASDLQGLAFRRQAVLMVKGAGNK